MSISQFLETIECSHEFVMAHRCEVCGCSGAYYFTSVHPARKVRHWKLECVRCGNITYQEVLDV